jgi:hypothetical protein
MITHLCWTMLIDLLILPLFLLCANLENLRFGFIFLLFIYFCYLFGKIHFTFPKFDNFFTFASDV